VIRTSRPAALAAVGRLLAGGITAVALLSGCWPSGGTSGLSSGLPGLRLAGTLEGRQVAVNDGLPRLQYGDCDPMDGADADLCVISRSIDGRLFVLVAENPAVLAPTSGGSGPGLAVRDPGCATPQACDDVADAAVVDVQLDTGQRRRAVDGTLALSLVEPLLRYAGELTVHLPDGGRLSGQFDLVPTPDR
jgi:hypothetical protein